MEGHSVQDLRQCGGAVGNRRAGSSGLAEVGARCGQGSPRGLGMRRGTTRPGGAGGAGAMGGSSRCSSSFSIRNPARHGGNIDRVRGPLPQPLPPTLSRAFVLDPVFFLRPIAGSPCPLPFPRSRRSLPVPPEPALVAARSPQPALPARLSWAPSPAGKGGGRGVFRGEPASRSAAAVVFVG